MTERLEAYVGSRWQRQFGGRTITLRVLSLSSGALDHHGRPQLRTTPEDRWQPRYDSISHLRRHYRRIIG